MNRLLLGIALAALAGCSGTPTTKKVKEPEKPLDPLTGRQAYQQMYPAARAWAADCEPLRVRSIRLADVKAEPGKSGAWEVLFVSQSRGRSRIYTWSAIEAEGNLHKGVFAGLEEGWGGPRGQAQPFRSAALRSDTTEAWDAAGKKYPEDLKKLGPDRPVNFLLEWTPRFPNPAWRILWGETVSTAVYSVFVDASTGQVLERVR